MEFCPEHGGCSVTIKRLGEDVAELFEAKENQTQTLYELREHCKILDKSYIDAHTRLNDHAELIKSIKEIAEGIGVMTYKQEETNKQVATILEQMGSQNKRLDHLERQPAVEALARQERIKATIMTVVVTSATAGTIGYVIALSKLVAR